MVAPSPAILVLEDGTVFNGRSVGAAGERACELVFNTAMTGYQEILTDPSYRGQGVVMTYPQIGNYGCTEADDESNRCWAETMIMRECSPIYSNWRAECSLPEYLEQHGVVAIDGIDTRELTLKLRKQGEMRAVISTDNLDHQTLLAKARSHQSLDGRNLAIEVSCKSSYDWSEALPDRFNFPEMASSDNLEDISSRPIPLVVYDFGVKRNILRCLVSAGFAPTVVPAKTTAAEVLAMNPEAVFLSNGPGDPAAVVGAPDNIRELANQGLPILGICLGHQILAHVFGASTMKMKFGHHGVNHPVIEMESGRIDITSQNHSFAVDPGSLEGTGLIATHRNGNDDSIEGMRHTEMAVFSVQYHPEAAPGPHDAAHLFARFRQLVLDNQHQSA